jgi:hypothetical protein
MVALGTSVLLLGPALGPGYVLSYDMVFVPRMPFTARLLGTDGSVPRAVPSDALVALASRVVDGATLQKVILLAVLVVGGMGAARLVRRRGRAASAVAVVFAVWNPYVASRLWLGQWAILVAYAVLPWLVLAAARLRRGDRRRAALVVVLLALAALTASGGLLAAASALCVVAFAAHDWSDRWRQLMLVLVASIVVNLPWLLPAVLRRAAWPADPQAFDAFAARADTPLGTIGSVVTLGGTWNAQVMPAGRDSWWTATLVLLIGVVALLGVWVTISDRPRPAWAVGLAVAAAGSTAAALAASVPVSARLLRELAVHLPGLALLRDGTRYLPPLVLLTVVGLATGARWLADRIEPRTLAPVVVTFALLAPLVALIGAAWGDFGALRTVDYPAGWAQARAAVAGEPDHGAVVSLPWGAYRRYAWNIDRTVYDPATRWLPAPVITDDRLRVGDVVLPGEDPQAAAVTALLDGADDRPLADALAEQGVGWVLVTDETGIAAPPAVWFDGMTKVVDTADLQLWQVPDPAPVETSIRAAPLVMIVDVAVAVLIVVCVVVACRPNRAARTGGAASMTTQPSSGSVKESPQ